MIKGGAPLTERGALFCFSEEKIAKNCEKQEKERLRTQKKHSNPLQFANNA